MKTQPQEIVPIEADGQGSIAGYKTNCACGLVMTNSLLSGIELDAAKHLDWHRAQATKSRVRIYK